MGEVAVNGVTQQVSSLSVKADREDNFLKTIKGLVVATVFRYAALGGMYEENRNILKDMIQEAQLAVLEEFRKRGCKYENNLDVYRGVIKNACLKTVADARTVRVPAYWLTRVGRKKRLESGAKSLEEYECLSVEGILEEDNIEVLGVDSFEDWMTLKIVIEDLFMKSSEKEKRIFTLLGSGFTGVEVSKILHIKKNLVYYYIDKAKQTLIDGGLGDGTQRGKSKGKSRTASLVGTV